MTHSRTDRGAVLVEFAILMPFLFLVIFGIIEFGWAFSRDLDVRHGARETSRLVAVNYRPVAANSGSAQVADIIDEVCGRIGDPADTAISMRVPPGQGAPVGQGGQKAEVNVQRELDTLTGFLDFALPTPITLSSTVEVRLEVSASWTTDTNWHSGSC
jgi:Flp pilus assembly protein TadG